MTFKIIKFRKSNERFISRKEWLQSMHSFSFGNYSNSDWDNFGKIRVINEDIISPKSGFGYHSHLNMEIITFVIKGAISHRDSLNNFERINENEIQIISAGDGISHSEKNEENKICKLFQVWIYPNKKNIKPSYKKISLKNTFGDNLIIDSSEITNNKLFINQDILIWRCKYNSMKEKQLPYEIKKINWLQIIEGNLLLISKDNKRSIYLSSGDGLGFEISNYEDVLIKNEEAVDFLIFSMPSL